MKTPLFLAALLLASASFAQSSQNGIVETIATVETEVGTEDICQAPDGTLYVTILQETTIWKIAPGGQTERFAVFPEKVGIVGCAPYNGGLIIATLTKPYLRPRTADAPPGPNFDFSDVGPEILILDETGQVVSTVPGRAGQMFTAVTELSDGQYLVADALGTTIWLLDPQTGGLEPWFEDDRFLRDTAGQPPLGMDGLAAHDGVVVAGNISRRTLYRIDVGSDGRPEGDPVLLAEGEEFIPNDFDVGPGGIAYIPSDTSIFKVTASGEVSVLVDDVPNGGAAIVDNGGEWLYWPTRGSVGTPPGTERVLRVPLE